MWCKQVQLDYSSLSREHKAVSEGKERDKLAAQFQADIDERSALLAKLAPNLKAVEQYEAVKVSLCAQLALTGGHQAAPGSSTNVCWVTCQAVPCNVLSIAAVACCRSCSKFCRFCKICSNSLLREHLVRRVGRNGLQQIWSCNTGKTIAMSALLS